MRILFWTCMTQCRHARRTPSAATRAIRPFDRKVQRILTPGKQPDRVVARSVLAYWAVRELGVSATSAGKELGLSQSATHRPVRPFDRLGASLCEVGLAELRPPHAGIPSSSGIPSGSGPSASRAVERGEQIVAQRGLSLHTERNA